MLSYVEHRILIAIMELNASSLVNRVSALAQSQPHGWQANAVRALGDANMLVQRSFLDERDEAAAIAFLDKLIECRDAYIQFLPMVNYADLLLPSASVAAERAAERAAAERAAERAAVREAAERAAERAAVREAAERAAVREAAERAAESSGES